jgi:GNAT superfamily N-acetyltransferase
MNEIKISVSRDRRELNRLVKGLYEDFGKPFSETISTWLDKGPSDDEFWEVYLIRIRGKTVGICGLYSQYENPDMKELWLGWFGVLPKYRSSGIGKKALLLMEERARKLGSLQIMSYVNNKGKPLGFYYRNGFSRLCSVLEYLKKHKELDKDEFENDTDHVIKKELFM